MIRKATDDDSPTLCLGKGGQCFTLTVAPSSPADDWVHIFLDACFNEPVVKVTTSSSTLSFSDLLVFCTAPSASLVPVAQKLPQRPFMGLLACENYNHQFVIRTGARRMRIRTYCTCPALPRPSSRSDIALVGAQHCASVH